MPFLRWPDREPSVSVQPGEVLFIASVESLEHFEAARIHGSTPGVRLESLPDRNEGRSGLEAGDAPQGNAAQQGRACGSCILRVLDRLHGLSCHIGEDLTGA